jgi:hypothetical protein
MDYNKLPRPVEPKLYELWKKYQDLAFLHALYDSDHTNRPHIASITEEYEWDILDWYNLYHSGSIDIDQGESPIPTETRPSESPDPRTRIDRTNAVHSTLAGLREHVTQARKSSDFPASRKTGAKLVYTKESTPSHF